MAGRPYKVDNTPGVGYRVDGALLNRYATDHNAVNLSSHGGNAQNTHHVGPVKTEVIQAPFQMGVLVITDGANTCDADTDPRGNKKPACISENLYRGRFNWYDHDNNIWQEDDVDVWLDASAYWEGRTESGELAGDGEKYKTDASRRLTSGPGYGPIPLFRRGERVPCYYDRQRGWAVPIVSPPADVPRANFALIGPKTIGDATLADFPAEETISIFLEARFPHRGEEWTMIEAICFRVPWMLEGEEWCDTRSGFAFFESRGPDGKGTDHTLVRLRAVSTASFGSVVQRAQLHLYGAGRKAHDDGVEGPDPFHDGYGWATHDTQHSLNGGTVIDGLDMRANVIGRFRDQPKFSTVDVGGNAVIQIEHEDPLDRWVIGVQFSVTISPEEGGFSQSSMSSTSSASSTSQSSLNSSSSSSPATSESSHSLTSTSSTSLTSESSDSSSLAENEGFCCTTLVSDVKCIDGLVSQVCYQTICFPSPRALPAGFCKSAVWCVPCGIDDLDNSSSSSSSSSETTTTEVEEYFCEEVPLEELINPDYDYGEYDETFTVTQNAIDPQPSMRLWASGSGVGYSSDNTYLGSSMFPNNRATWVVRTDSQDAVFGVTAVSAPTAADNHYNYEYGIQTLTGGEVRIWRGGAFSDIAGSTHNDYDKYEIRRTATVVEIIQNGAVIESFTGDAQNLWRPMATLTPNSTWVGTTTGNGSEPTHLTSMLTEYQDAGDDYWEAAILSNALDIEVTSHNGLGAFSWDTNEGTVSYTPSAAEVFTGFEVEAEVLICDGVPEPIPDPEEPEPPEHDDNSSSSELCADFQVASPQTAETVTSTECIDLNPLGDGNVGGDLGPIWETILDNGDLSLVGIHDGSGTLTIDNSSGIAQYCPPGDGSESGVDVHVTFTAEDLLSGCDTVVEYTLTIGQFFSPPPPEQEESSSSSSVSSSSSSSSSPSSSLSSASSSSQSASTSSSSLTSSNSSSSLTSSQSSSSSSSSSVTSSSSSISSSLSSSSSHSSSSTSSSSESSSVTSSSSLTSSSSSSSSSESSSSSVTSSSSRSSSSSSSNSSSITSSSSSSSSSSLTSSSSTSSSSTSSSSVTSSSSSLSNSTSSSSVTSSSSSVTSSSSSSDLSSTSSSSSSTSSESSSSVTSSSSSSSIAGQLMFWGSDAGKSAVHTRAVGGTMRLIDYSRDGTPRDMQPGRAYTFNGSSDYITLGTNPIDTEDFAVSVWIRPTAHTGTVLASVGLSGGAFLSVSILSNSTVQVTIDDDANIVQVVSATALTLSEWAHLAVSVDRDGEMNLWINGVLEDTADVSFANATLAGSALVIGRLGVLPVIYFTGQMFDFRLFDAVLGTSDAEEMTAMAPGSLAVGPHAADAWYKMDESAGLVAFDSSGSDNRGTISSITHDATLNDVYSFQNEHGFRDETAGIPAALIPRDESDHSLDALGNSLTYSGQCPHDAVLYQPSFTAGAAGADTVDMGGPVVPDANVPNLTVGCWLKTTNASLRAAVSQYNETAGPDPQDRFMFLGASGSLARIMFGEGATVTTVESTSTVNDGEWHHVVATYDQSDTGAEIKIYFDGNFEASASKASISGNVSNFRISGIDNAATVSHRWVGQIADAQVHDRTLCGDEIKAWYEGTSPGQENVLGNWPLCEGAGLVLHDISGNGNHGDLTTADVAASWANQQNVFDSLVQNGAAVSTYYDGASHTDMPTLDGTLFEDGFTFDAWVYRFDSLSGVLVGVASGSWKQIIGFTTGNLRTQVNAGSSWGTNGTSEGVWEHYIWTFKPNGDQAHIINGTDKVRRVADPVLPAAPGTDYARRLGAWSGPSQWVNIQMSQLRIHKDQVSDSQAVDMYNGDPISNDLIYEADLGGIAAPGATPTGIVRILVPSGAGVPINVGPGVLHPGSSVHLDGGEANSPYAQQLASVLSDLVYDVGDDDEASSLFVRLTSAGDDRLMVALPAATGSRLGLLTSLAEDSGDSSTSSSGSSSSTSSSSASSSSSSSSVI